MIKIAISKQLTVLAVLTSPSELTSIWDLPNILLAVSAFTTLSLAIIAFRQILISKNQLKELVKARNAELLLSAYEIMQTGFFTRANENNLRDLHWSKWTNTDKERVFKLSRRFQKLAVLCLNDFIDTKLVDELWGKAIVKYWNYMRKWIEYERKIGELNNLTTKDGFIFRGQFEELAVKLGGKPI